MKTIWPEIILLCVVLLPFVWFLHAIGFFKKEVKKQD